jgi:hypothetical protein
MPEERWKNRKTIRTVLGCVFVAALISASVGSAMAGDDEEEDNLPDAVFFRNVLKGFGLKRGDDTIDYRERSPLVVPPTRDLPPPETDVPVKNTNAAWPVDPDVKRKKAAAAAQHKVSSIDESRALRPNEMMPGGTDVKGTPQTSLPSDAPPDGAPMKPSQLGFNGWSFTNLFSSPPESATFTHEPTRESLTEPPAGYRTPAPNEPYGVSKDKAGTAKAYDFMNQHGTE